MRQIISVFILLGVLLSGGAAWSQSTGTYTLQQCIETGLAQNLIVQQSGLTAEGGRIDWKQAKLNMLPDLNANVEQGTSSGRSIDPFTNGYINQNVNFSSYGASSGVTLFNGLALQNSVKRASLTYQADKMDWQQAKDNLTINIILAYLLVLSDEDQLEQAKSQLGSSAEQVQRLEVLNRDGAIPPSQLSDLKGQYGADQLTISNTQNALETAKISLCELMNIPYDKNMKLERMDVSAIANKYEDAPDQVYQTALKQFAQVKVVDLRRESAAANVKVARGLMYPQLSFNANVNTNYSNAARSDVFVNTTDVTTDDFVVVGGNQSQVIHKQDNFISQKIPYGTQLNGNLFTTFSLNLRIPIFNALRARNQVSLAKLELKNRELIAQSTRTGLQQSIERAYSNMTSALDQYKILQDQVAAYTESFKAAEIKFNEGVGTSVDYTIAKTNMDRSNTALINAKYDALLRMKILDYYQGRKLW